MKRSPQTDIRVLQLLEAERVATQSRINVLRMIDATPAGHVGGALSCIDALAVLYTNILRIAPNTAKDPQRDRFLLSAGHKALAQYAILAERGFFPTDYLDQYGKENTKLGGHPDMHKLPGIEGNTGALGHGLPLGTGMALGLRLRGLDARTFLLLGDGELPGRIELGRRRHRGPLRAGQSHRCDRRQWIADQWPNL